MIKRQFKDLNQTENTATVVCSTNTETYYRQFLGSDHWICQADYQTYISTEVRKQQKTELKKERESKDH